MGTIQSRGAPGPRVEIGNAVLEAARGLDTQVIKARLAAFEKAHKAYAAAHAQGERAQEALRARQSEVGERDVDQDEAVMNLANALVGEGLPRKNPFKPLGFVAPSRLVDLGYAEEAKKVRRLVAAVLKRKGLSKAGAQAARAAEKAALAVDKALAALGPFEQAHKAALARRDGLAQGWETKFAALKRGARWAADEGAPDLFAALFEREESRPRRNQAAPPASLPPNPAPT
jgi:hypothetical protein